MTAFIVGNLSHIISNPYFQSLFYKYETYFSTSEDTSDFSFLRYRKHIKDLLGVFLQNKTSRKLNKIWQQVNET